MSRIKFEMDKAMEKTSSIENTLLKKSNIDYIMMSCIGVMVGDWFPNIFEV